MIDPAMLEQLKAKAPGYYTERDDDDWYVVVPDHSDRLGEGFVRRSDAHRFLLWLTGDPLPDHWKIQIHGDGRLAYDVDCGQGYIATLWIPAVRKFFPARADQIVELCAQADKNSSAT